MTYFCAMSLGFLPVRTVQIKFVVNHYFLFGSICVCLFFCSPCIYSQKLASYLSHSDSFNLKRTSLSAGFTAATYTGFSIGLYQAWYKHGELTKFHFFDDSREWKYMDKCGHAYDGYFQTALCYQGARWAGLGNRKSVLVASVIANVFQTTIEVYDGFSKKWGFSWADISSNLIGSGFFIVQQQLWHEQRFLIKFSSYPSQYNTTIPSIKSRVSDLYGSALPEKLLKDYNAQTYWLSFNPNVFYKDAKWPSYVNIALGYGAQGMYGGYLNDWIDASGNHISLDNINYPRYNQYYLSLDLDLRKIPTHHSYLKTLFFVLNIFKIPSPSLEYNSLGKTKFHWLFF